MSAATLHITNGDSVLYLFKKAGILGTHVAWRDALNEGPVPAGLPLEATSAVRVAYHAERGYGNPIKTAYAFEKRDALLKRAGEFREIVLWFEHDLFDQLQLLQVITALEDLAIDPSRANLIQCDQYLGSMTAEELCALLPRRRPVTAATSKSARRAWQRFTSGDPDDLLTASREDAIGLPYLRAALQRLCEEYPATSDGLSRSQRQALTAAMQGPADAGELYRRAQGREEAHFQGNTAFSRMLTDLCDERAALHSAGEDGSSVSPLGRRVLAGESDWLEAHPIDRWIGGVHLTPERVVRWNEHTTAFVKPEAAANAEANGD